MPSTHRAFIIGGFANVSEVATGSDAILQMISFDLVMLLSSMIHLTILLIYINNLIFLIIRSRAQTSSISSSPKIELTQEVVTKSQVLMLKPIATPQNMGGLKNFPNHPMPPRNLEVQDLQSKELDRTQYLPEEIGEQNNVKVRMVESKTGTDDVNRTQATRNEEEIPLLWQTQPDDDYFAIDTKASKKSPRKHLKQSQRKLPRAPKGTHDEELKDMEEFINEMETPTPARHS